MNECAWTQYPNNEIRAVEDLRNSEPLKKIWDHIYQKKT
jgi:hypothetical protein